MTNKEERLKARRIEQKRKEQLLRELLAMLEQQREASIQAARRIPERMPTLEELDAIKAEVFKAKVR